jgi:hypothetical protein
MATTSDPVGSCWISLKDKILTKIKKFCQKFGNLALNLCIKFNIQHTLNDPAKKISLSRIIKFV